MSLNLTNLEYLRLLATIQSGVATIDDYTNIRSCFAKTTFFAPFDNQENTEDLELRRAFSMTDFHKTLKIANRILVKNFLHIWSHFYACQAGLALNENEVADFHRIIGNGILESIASSGDGRSELTPYKVISIAEEHAFLRIYYREGVKILQHRRVKYLDIFQVENLNDESTRHEVYFDGSIPSLWLNQNDYSLP
jgi:hypothetical protein